MQGVILDMCECLVEMLLEGKKVQLGALGDFFISLNSVGAESLKAFTAANIKAVNVVFTPGTDFDGLIERAKFNPVASRTAQAATLKAEKEGPERSEASRMHTRGCSRDPSLCSG